MKDSNGIQVSVGDTIEFSYGIPPVWAVGKVVLMAGRMYVLVPDHYPSVYPLRSLRRAVGDWWKQQEAT